MAEDKYHFERLTPIDNMNLDVYEEAIDYVFNNPDVKNVAISGAYSAGKSSVLASYKKRHDDLRFLHISLAHFKSPDQEDETDIKESVLEGKILNQLIHQIPSDKIPQTNFRVKKSINPVSTIMNTLKTIVLLTAIIYFMFFDSWKSYVSVLPDNWLKSILELSTHPYALMVDGVIIIILSSFLIYELIKIQKNKNVFRKLNLQGNEIEIFEESDCFGGISKTVNYKGNRMDMGGHRFFSKIPEVNAWWDHMLPMQGHPTYDDIILHRPMPVTKKSAFYELSAPLSNLTA